MITIRPSRSLALHGPLIVMWNICTFGYSYPRRRVGENYMVCVIRVVVIAVARMACLLGAIWYIWNLVEYQNLGGDRPLNILVTQENTNYTGTITPKLNILSTATGDLNVTDVLFSNLTGNYGLEVGYSRGPSGLGEGDTIFMDQIVDTLQAQSFDYVQVVIKHDPILPPYGWSQVSLIHPLSWSTTFSTMDLFNQYYFLPGHFVEIRYTPLTFNYYPTITPSNTTLEKFVNFLGFTSASTDYSYQSTVAHIPFPSGVYDNLTTVIILRPQSTLNQLSYQTEKTTFRDTMSSIGGLLGIVGSFIGFLFGASVLSPWGFIAGIPFFRRKISGSLAKAYDTPDGLSKGPFTTKIEEVGQFGPEIHEKGNGSVSAADLKLTMLKERLDELELVLSEYYLDGDVFKTYADERKKIKLERARSLLGSSRKTFTGGLFRKVSKDQKEYSALMLGNLTETAASPMTGEGIEQTQNQPLSTYPQKQEFNDSSSSMNWMLPSQTLKESQHQHRGPLPSPEHPPQPPASRVSTSEPSVFAYYQQQHLDQHSGQNQQQQQQQQGQQPAAQNQKHQRVQKTLSAQSLVRPMAGGDPSTIQIPTRRSSSFHEQDSQSLLQQDHNSLRNSTYAVNNVVTGPPSYPPRPQYSGTSPIALNTAAAAASNPYAVSAVSAALATSPQVSQGNRWFSSPPSSPSSTIVASPTQQLVSPSQSFYSTPGSGVGEGSISSLRGLTGNQQQQLQQLQQQGP
ncbi:hypothetical protein EMPS_07941 [Entomortierella parvispora]|uniref:Uncharacterized protein n=1 Tax=Entomortierella parvispora TaxID=205924 RepID=A0A9P3HFG1_9FUNG|nr:hypothetical protein EMPS_07941 [Entomortierella parvispora]